MCARMLFVHCVRDLRADWHGMRCASTTGAGAMISPCSKDAAKKAKKTTASYEGTRAVPGAYKLAAPNPPRNGAKRPSVIARKQKQLKSKKGKK